jgi:hypothetical protein
VQSNDRFRQYNGGGFRKQCKTCDNEYDKLRKKKQRHDIALTTIIDCTRCGEEKPLVEFAKLKKHDKKLCCACYLLHVKECKKEWCKLEQKNPHYRIRKSLAARLRTVLQKKASTMKYIGCDILFLREWLEYNFTYDMTWENYGQYWSIDHVIPVNKFNLEIESVKYECWNWSNLFPVTIQFNCSKKDNLDADQIRLVKTQLLRFQEEGSTTKWFSEDKCVLLRYSLNFT